MPLHDMCYFMSQYSRQHRIIIWQRVEQARIHENVFARQAEGVYSGL